MRTYPGVSSVVLLLILISNGCSTESANDSTPSTEDGEHVTKTAEKQNPFYEANIALIKQMLKPIVTLSYMGRNVPISQERQAQYIEAIVDRSHAHFYGGGDRRDAMKQDRKTAGIITISSGSSEVGIEYSTDRFFWHGKRDRQNLFHSLELVRLLSDDLRDVEGAEHIVKWMEKFLAGDIPYSVPDCQRPPKIDP